MNKAMVFVAALCLAGCYTGPSPEEEQAQRDADARAAAFNQLLAEQQRAEAAQDAQTARMCAAATDDGVRVACAQWEMERRKLAWQRWQAQQDAQARAAAEAQRRQQEDAERRRERRRAIGEAIQAGADYYSRAMQNMATQNSGPRNCTSLLNGNLISTTCN